MIDYVKFVNMIRTCIINKVTTDVSMLVISEIKIK